MRPRKVVTLLLVALVVIVGSSYIRVSLAKAARPPQPGTPPSLDDAPVRAYGVVEPLGRGAYVGPLQPRRVTAVVAREGDTVAEGDVLVRLDDDLERHAVRIAESRLEEALRRLAITRDELRRTQSLARGEAVPEFEATRLALQAELEEQQVRTARAEVELRRAELEKLALRAPLAGIVYKLDVRVGEQLSPQDYQRIVVGSPSKQVRLFLETFWMGRISLGQRFVVREAQSLREVGTGVVEHVAPYVGARDFRTEDALERLDTKYAQVVLRLETETPVPLGLQVVCERAEDGSRRGREVSRR